MKLFLMMMAFGVVLTGCTALNTVADGIAGKSISGSGTVVKNVVGLDTQTQTPELSSLVVVGDYTSIANGDEILRYEVLEDASIFNSNSKSKTVKLFFASSDKTRMDAALTKVADNIKTDGDSGTDTNLPTAESEAAK